MQNEDTPEEQGLTDGISEAEKQELLREYRKAHAETEELRSDAEKNSIEISKDIISDNSQSRLGEISDAMDKVMRIHKKGDKLRAAISYLENGDATDLTQEGLANEIEKWS